MFLEKIINNLKLPYSASISEFQKHINSTYHVEIPPTFINSILLRPTFRNNGVEIKKHYLVITKIPNEVEIKINALQKQADDDCRNIFSEFNKYLKQSGHEAIKFAQFIEIIEVYHKKLIDDIFSCDSDYCIVFFEWCNQIFKSDKGVQLKEALNKLIYSWFIYYYFHTLKRQKRKLQNFKLIIDTNILVYLLGINGQNRKEYVLS